ncbi:MAG: hypothetical protein U9N59_07375 [Campylobacterota bacterium]|nr:hypothetical protein [Campylobacterota bacterium]
MQDIENKSMQLFQSQEIRTQWDDEKELWYFSFIDVIVILTQSERPRKYWSDLKEKLNKEGSEVSEKIGQLKLKANDGKMRLTDVAKVAKESLELKTGKKVVTNLNAKTILTNKQKKIQ